MMPADIREPLVSPELSAVPQPTLRKVYEYDVDTTPGMALVVKAK